MTQGADAEFHMNAQKERFLTSTWGALLAAALCCLLWGSAFPCIKVGYALFGIASTDTASQMLFAGTRFVIAGFMVILFVSIAWRKPLVPRRTDIGPIALLALFQTFGQYAFFYLGLAHAAGTTSSVIEASANFFAILLSALAFRQERLTGRKVAGCLLGFSGVVLINLGGSLGSRSLSFSSLLLSVNSVSRISVYGFMNPVFGFVLSAVLLGEYQQVDPVRSVCALALVSAGIVVVNHVSAKPGSTVGASGSELR